VYLEAPRDTIVAHFKATRNLTRQDVAPIALELAPIALELARIAFRVKEVAFPT
jgi:hypothetical protein